MGVDVMPLAFLGLLRGIPREAEYRGGHPAAWLAASPILRSRGTAADILDQTGGRLSQPPRYHTALVRGPPAPPLTQPYIKLLCCMRAAIESFWLDSASTRSVPVDISGQSSICAAGHCPGKSAARPQMPSRSQLRQLTAAAFPLPPT